MQCRSSTRRKYFLRICASFYKLIYGLAQIRVRESRSRFPYESLIFKDFKKYYTHVLLVFEKFKIDCNSTHSINVMENSGNHWYKNPYSDCVIL